MKTIYRIALLAAFLTTSNTNASNSPIPDGHYLLTDARTLMPVEAIVVTANHTQTISIPAFKIDKAQVLTGGNEFYFTLPLSDSRTGISLFVATFHDLTNYWGKISALKNGKANESSFSLIPLESVIKAEQGAAANP